MTKYDFYKYHALGNDYIVIDPRRNPIVLNSEKIRLICHRNFGIGSDGILLGPIIKNGGMTLKIYNPDGSEAEKSGNGIRIFSRFLVDAGYVRSKKFFLVTKGGRVEVELMDRKAQVIKVDMGPVSFRSRDIPVSGLDRDVVNEPLDILGELYRVTCLSIGNPHCAILMDDISRERAMLLGPYVENHPQFPKRINMQLVKVVDRKNIQIEIWERGAGYTLASGSSSCAAASAVHRLGLSDSAVSVHMPGGIIDVEILENAHVMMTGSVNDVSFGYFSGPFKKELSKAGLPASTGKTREEGLGKIRTLSQAGLAKRLKRGKRSGDKRSGLSR